VEKEICALSSALQQQFQKLLQDYQVEEGEGDLVEKGNQVEEGEGGLSLQFKLIE
jgi:hypothetical protein